MNTNDPFLTPRQRARAKLEATMWGARNALAGLLVLTGFVVMVIACLWLIVAVFVKGGELVGIW